MTVSAKSWLETLAWIGLALVIGYFLVRDVPAYAVYTPEAYGSYWPTRAYLIPHVIGAGLAILVGLVQFSTRIRKCWPAVHRVSGRVYVTACVIGAPAALLLAVNSECATCKPALGSLSVYWFATTLIAFYFARHRSFATHRAFMIRSFVAMNVFVAVRIGYWLARPMVDEDVSVRTMVELVTVFGALLAVEAYFAWSGDLRTGNAIVRKRNARQVETP